jgi:hypothetical protein
MPIANMTMKNPTITTASVSESINDQNNIDTREFKTNQILAEEALCKTFIFSHS